MPKLKNKPARPLVDFSLLSLAGFSEVQIHVIHYLQQGFSLGEIAGVLHRSIWDVRYHIGAIGKKLGARGRGDILTRAIITTYELSVKQGRKELPLM